MKPDKGATRLSASRAYSSTKTSIGDIRAARYECSRQATQATTPITPAAAAKIAKLPPARG
jgi:hypothetical protein